jgi:hypothetical protein
VVYNVTPYTLLLAYGYGTNGYTSFPSGPQTLRVTARWGYSADPPGDVQEAVIAQVVRWWKRGQSAFADATANPARGDLQYAQVLDPDIRTILDGAGLVRQVWQ